MQDRSSFPVCTTPPLTLAGWLRHDRIRRLLRHCADVFSVLEIGAGEGALAVRLASTYDYTGIEPDRLAYEKARQRLATLGRGRVVHGELDALEPNTFFDLVCAFEVLEHIADDERALRDWSERLRPGGALVLTVPAGEHRLGRADILVGHHRRYEMSSLQSLLEGAGFRIIELDSFGFPLGYALEWLRHVLATFKGPASGTAESTGGGGRWLQPPDALAFATRILTAPFRAIDRMLPAAMPGTSIIALAKWGEPS